VTIDQQFIEFVVKSIVGNPDDVKIERTIDEKGVLLELTVNPEDLGRVIGKRGNTAQSMRTLLRALGTKNDARYNLKIIDNGEPRPKRDESAKDNSTRDNSTRDEDNKKTNEDSVKTEINEEAATAAGTAGANRWAHLSSLNDDDDEDKGQDTTDDSDDDEKSSTSSTGSSLEQTKKELADLDDIGL